MKIIKITICIFILSSITACGFRPLYSTTNTKTSILLKNIDIDPIPTIEGAEFYNHIKTLIPSTNDARFILKANLNYSKIYSIMQKNSDIMRETQVIKVTYYLIEKNTDKLITSGTFTKISSYSTTFSPYSNTIQAQETTTNLATTAAEEIRNRLILFFENKNL